jgi:multiple sugar transport system permease protein
MGRAVKNVVLVVTALLWLVPSWLLVVNSFTAAADYTGTPSWWPASWAFAGNVAEAFDRANVGAGMLNSLVYAVVGALIAVVVAALASFAVVVMPVKRPALWFWAIYVGTILPLQMFLAPLFSGYATTSLYDTQYGMLLIYAALAVPFAFFVVRNYMTTVPREMHEAAALDGASWLRMFVSIHLPLVRSAMLSTSPNVRPAMAALADLTSNYSNVGPPVVLAGALVASLPTVVLFFAFQRFFTRSLKLTS